MKRNPSSLETFFKTAKTVLDYPWCTLSVSTEHATASGQATFHSTQPTRANQHETLDIVGRIEVAQLTERAHNWGHIE